MPKLRINDAKEHPPELARLEKQERQCEVRRSDKLTPVS
jgi:hypothetical protein